MIFNRKEGLRYKTLRKQKHSVSADYNIPRQIKIFQNRAEVPAYLENFLL